jgi:hypothetical protein
MPDKPPAGMIDFCMKNATASRCWMMDYLSTKFDGRVEAQRYRCSFLLGVG